MKVLISTETVGGVLTYTAELAAALETQGIEVVVATMGSPPRPEQRALLPSRVHESDYRLEWMENPWEDVAAAGEWLLSLEEEERPDVVHLCSYAHGTVPFRAPKVLVAHSCILSCWRAVHGEEAPAEWDRYREKMSAGLTAADAVVAPTRAMLHELERNHELRPATAVVIYNGSSVQMAPAETEKRDMVMGSGSFWDSAKNLAALDAAAEDLAWPVTVAGELGPEGEMRHAKGTGPLAPADLAELRRGASIYAAPARYEPFGLGILEAARDRCALVLGYVPSLRELWRDAAIFIQPDDERALHEALEALIDDRPLRSDLARRAQRRAAEYSIQRAAHAYRRLYEQLVATREVVYA
jgi:glycogen synthase